MLQEKVERYIWQTTKAATMLSRLAHGHFRFFSLLAHSSDIILDICCF